LISLMFDQCSYEQFFLLNTSWSKWLSNFIFLLLNLFFMMIPFSSMSSIHTNAPNKNVKSLKKGTIHAWSKFCVQLDLQKKSSSWNFGRNLLKEMQNWERWHFGLFAKKINGEDSVNLRLTMHHNLHNGLHMDDVMFFIDAMMEMFLDFQVPCEMSILWTIIFICISNLFHGITTDKLNFTLTIVQIVNPSNLNDKKK